MPVWGLGPYGGPRRRMIIGIKERGRRDAVGPLAVMTTAAIEYLIARGELDWDIVIVPAPTLRASARRRGGDPVTRVARATGFDVAPLLEHSRSVKDQVGLDVSARRSNLSQGVTMVKNWQRIAADRGLFPEPGRGGAYGAVGVGKHGGNVTCAITGGMLVAESIVASRPARAVILLDDVITTGATMAASSAVLTSAGLKIRGGLGWSSA